jgi:hypothetical protein
MHVLRIDKGFRRIFLYYIKKTFQCYETRFFMVDLQHSTVNESSNDGLQNEHNFGILNHNIRCLGNKVMALNVLLSFWVSKPAILCFSEHWLNKEHLLHINIDHYKLAASFCKISDRHGGTHIYVLN